MIKIRLLLIFSMVFLLFVAASSAQQQLKKQTTNDIWVGEYGYTYTESQAQGGWIPVVEYLLVISAKGDSLVAHFTVDGYQANDNYSCTAKVSGNQLNLYFLKDLNDTNMERRTGRLKKGQLVGSLVKTTVRGRTRYIFKDKVFFNPKYLPTFKKS